MSKMTPKQNEERIQNLEKQNNDLITSYFFIHGERLAQILNLLRIHIEENYIDKPIQKLNKTKSFQNGKI